MTARNMWATFKSNSEIPKKVWANQVGDTPYKSAMMDTTQKAKIKKYRFNFIGKFKCSHVRPQVQLQSRHCPDVVLARFVGLILSRIQIHDSSDCSELEKS